MMKNKGRLSLYIACSLDGYIAGPNDDLSFLKPVEVEGTDYGYAEFMSGIDAVLTGRTTFEWVQQNAENFVHSDKEAYIITHDKNIQRDYPLITLHEILENDETRQGVRTYAGDLISLAKLLKSQSKNVYVEGGANVVHQLMQAKMIDEHYIAIVPVLLGNGTPLFLKEFPEQKLELLDVKKFESGLVMLHYSR